MSRNKNSRAPRINTLHESNCKNERSAASEICNFDSYTQQERALIKFQKQQQEREEKLIEVVVDAATKILVPEGCDVRKRIAQFVRGVNESRKLS